MTFLNGPTWTTLKWNNIWISQATTQMKYISTNHNCWIWIRFSTSGMHLDEMKKIMIEEVVSKKILDTRRGRKSRFPTQLIIICHSILEAGKVSSEIKYCYGSCIYLKQGTFFFDTIDAMEGWKPRLQHMLHRWILHHILKNSYQANCNAPDSLR